MFFVSLRSSSGGNCSLLSTGTENILIDCGVSSKVIQSALKEQSLTLSDINAVLVTHEHSDHIKGLKRLMGAYNIPVYTSMGTWNGICAQDRDGYFSFQGFELFRQIQADKEFYIGNTLVTPFRTYHDTAGSLGFRFDMEEAVFGHDASLGVITDCGHFDDYICSHLKGLDAVLIEANHDESMLMRGSYPLSLKRRILSDCGHQSNASCVSMLRMIYSDKLKNVLLAHLSQENNTPELALSFVKERFPVPGLSISVAPRDRCSEVVRL